MIDMRTGRYRLRTWLRGHLPDALAALAPKGSRDCGSHEWYRADAGTWRCYHCEPAVATSSPWTREEQLQHTLGGIHATLRALASHSELRDETDLLELRRLVREALDVLPDEEHRLERLATTSADELPRLVQALRAV